MLRLELAVDANSLISALLGGRALQLLFNPLFLYATTERTTWEVKRYISVIAERLGIAEIEVLNTFEDFPIMAYQSNLYSPALSRATNAIGHRDPKDIDILALAYHLRIPLWTQDLDLIDIEDIQTVTTQDLLAIIATNE